MPKYTSEQFWKLYAKLPQELKDAASAEETGDHIYETCERNDVTDKLGDIVEYTGQVLIGLLPPEDFQETLERELKLKKEVAKKVSQEINRFIFFPVKESLAALYSIGGAATAKTSAAPAPETPTGTVSREETAPAATRPAPPEIEAEAKPIAKPIRRKGADRYREPVE